jgi:hypothetical protein
MFVGAPLQHEIPDESVRVSQHDGDEQNVVLANLDGLVCLSFQQCAHVVSTARFAVEITVDVVAFVDGCEPIEVTRFKVAKNES